MANWKNVSKKKYANLSAPSDGKGADYLIVDVRKDEDIREIVILFSTSQDGKYEPARKVHSGRCGVFRPWIHDKTGWEESTPEEKQAAFKHVEEVSSMVKKHFLWVLTAGEKYGSYTPAPPISKTKGPGQTNSPDSPPSSPGKKAVKVRKASFKSTLKAALETDPGSVDKVADILLKGVPQGVEITRKDIDEIITSIKEEKKTPPSPPGSSPKDPGKKKAEKPANPPTPPNA